MSIFSVTAMLMRIFVKYETMSSLEYMYRTTKQSTPTSIIYKDIMKTSVQSNASRQAVFVSIKAGF